MIVAVRLAIPTVAATLLFAWPACVMAQAAAESAQILAGVAGQGKAVRSLGSAISGGMNGAANAISAARGRGMVINRRGNGAAHQPYAITTSGDVLEGTDAPTYLQGNGATIRVSRGALVRSPKTACVSDCPGNSASTPVAP